MQNRARALTRAWGASGFAVALAAGSHLLAGGHAPHPVLIAVAWALGAVIALPFTSRRPSLGRLAGLLLPAQLIYHFAFGGSHAMGSSGVASSEAAAQLGAHAGHAAHAMLGTTQGFGALGTSDPGSGALSSGALSGVVGQLSEAAAAQASLGMMAAHVLSAVLSVLAIRHVERGLAAASHWCRLRLNQASTLPRIPVLPRRTPRIPALHDLPRPHLLGLPLASLRRRGPPELPAFA